MLSARNSFISMKWPAWTLATSFASSEANDDSLLTCGLVSPAPVVGLASTSRDNTPAIATVLNTGLPDAAEVTPRRASGIVGTVARASAEGITPNDAEGGGDEGGINPIAATADKIAPCTCQTRPHPSWTEDACVARLGGPSGHMGRAVANCSSKPDQTAP